jgi:hypothetical protein
LIELVPMQARLICAVALLLILAGACGRQETQKTLARRLGNADRVTIADKYPDQRVFVMPLTPQEANRLAQAIANAKRESEVITASPELRIIFFKGTNLLGAFDAGGVGVFWIDHGPDPAGPTGVRRVVTYSDSTGMLEMLSQRFRHEKAAQGPTK